MIETQQQRWKLRKVSSKSSSTSSELGLMEKVGCAGLRLVKLLKSKDQLRRGSGSYELEEPARDVRFAVLISRSLYFGARTKMGLVT
jgi:hypothetical protein